jgi:hypothetical protein
MHPKRACARPREIVPAQKTHAQMHHTQAALGYLVMRICAYECTGRHTKGRRGESSGLIDWGHIAVLMRTRAEKLLGSIHECTQQAHGAGRLVISHVWDGTATPIRIVVPILVHCYRCLFRDQSYLGLGWGWQLYQSAFCGNCNRLANNV